MSKTKKILLIISSAILIVFIVILSIVLWLFSALLNKTPAVVYAPHVPDFTVLNSTIQKISAGQNAETDLSSMLDPNAIFETEFTEKEVNEIILNGIQTYIVSGDDPIKTEILKNLSLKFNNGIFEAKYSLDTKIKTPFGSYINFYCSFIPTLSNRDISITVQTFKIGKISFPTSQINKKIAEQIEKEKNTKEFNIFINAVKEIKIQERNLKIKYSPAALLNLITSQAQ